MATPGKNWADGVWAEGVWAEGVWAQEDAPGDDTTPDAFSFTDVSGAALSTQYTSAAITVSSIDSAATITITGGTYDINASGTFVSTSGTVNNGDTVRARATSSGSYLTGVDVVITIGGVSDTFTITTRTEPAAEVDGGQGRVRCGGMMVFG